MDGISEQLVLVRVGGDDPPYQCRFDGSGFASDAKGCAQSIGDDALIGTPTFFNFTGIEPPHVACRVLRLYLGISKGLYSSMNTGTELVADSNLSKANSVSVAQLRPARA